MRHLAAYLLLVAGGNATPTADDVCAVLGSVGAEADQDRLNQLMGELEGKSPVILLDLINIVDVNTVQLTTLIILGKDVNEIIAAGKEKLIPIMSGGGGGGGGAAAATEDAPAAAAPAPKEEEVDALEGGMDMFGGGGSDY